MMDISPTHSDLPAMQHSFGTILRFIGRLLSLIPPTWGQGLSAQTRGQERPSPVLGRCLIGGGRGGGGGGNGCGEIGIHTNFLNDGEPAG